MLNEHVACERDCKTEPEQPHALESKRFRITLRPERPFSDVPVPMLQNNANLARELLSIARTKKLTLVTAESCTAGQLCKTLSDAKGAADHFHGGFVTYTKQQKHRALGVSDQVLRAKGAVCPEVACAMAEGALQRSEADLSVSITGVAGPARDEDDNPVGRICIGIARRQGPTHCSQRDFGEGERDEIRNLAVAAALHALIVAAEDAANGGTSSDSRGVDHLDPGAVA